MEFAGWLTISRLPTGARPQDYQQIAMLAFIQLIAATVLTTDLAYAGLFLAFVVVTPWVLTLSHLRAEIERNYPRGDRAARRHRPESRARVASYRRAALPARGPRCSASPCC